jgi:nucleotide-binding universal stress UspA family protein
MVVMGTQGRGHIGEMFLGSVSNKVVRYSPVPVLLVPLVHS